MFFCLISTGIDHGYTCVPSILNPLSLSQLPIALPAVLRDQAASAPVSCFPAVGQTSTLQAYSSPWESMQHPLLAEGLPTAGQVALVTQGLVGEQRWQGQAHVHGPQKGVGRQEAVGAGRGGGSVPGTTGENSPTSLRWG